MKSLKTQIKLALPWYITGVGVLFALVYPLVRGITFYDEIGIALDRIFPFLSLVLFADTYHGDILGKTAENFYLRESGRQTGALLARLLWKLGFLSLLFLVSYRLFLFRSPRLFSVEEIPAVLFWEAAFAVVVGALFWGGLSCFLVNALRSLWAGVGLGIVLYLALASKHAEKLPAAVNMFAYGIRPDWQSGKIFEASAGVALALLSARLAAKSPFRPRW
ncbi:MAG: hypothetical protein LBQ15_09595 [Clostridium sp.]|jgi:hypothetical protein|nr:hypothetical protein [Clostridium sp.]